MLRERERMKEMEYRGDGRWIKAQVQNDSARWRKDEGEDPFTDLSPVVRIRRRRRNKKIQQTPEERLNSVRIIRSSLERFYLEL